MEDYPRNLAEFEARFANQVSKPIDRTANPIQGFSDEFTFRFNRRKSRSRGKLFYRLVQQAVAVQVRTTTTCSDRTANPFGEIRHVPLIERRSTAGPRTGRGSPHVYGLNRDLRRPGRALRVTPLPRTIPKSEIAS